MKKRGRPRTRPMEEAKPREPRTLFADEKDIPLVVEVDPDTEADEEYIAQMIAEFLLEGNPDRYREQLEAMADMETAI